MPSRARILCALVGAAVALAIASPALADLPQLGGPMKHILVWQVDTTLYAALEGDPNEVLQLQTYDTTYDPPADVLNGMAYNGQYGWLANGFFSLPAGAGVWVEVVAQSPELSVYEQDTYVPIFGTDGAATIWQWNGTMVHNWYATDTCGGFGATYSIYVGDSSGAPLAGYTPATIDLMWEYRPFVPGDLTGDGAVNLSDLGQMLPNYGVTSGASYEDGDIDGDGDVDLSDLGTLLSQYGVSCV